MSYCSDPYEHRREGRNAARWGENYSYDVQERLRNGRWDSDSCDAAFRKGYEEELRRREEQRAEERAAEEAAEQRAYERAAEEAYWETQQQEQPYPEEPQPAEDDPKGAGGGS